MVVSSELSQVLCIAAKCAALGDVQRGNACAMSRDARVKRDACAVDRSYVRTIRCAILMMHMARFSYALDRDRHERRA